MLQDASHAGCVLLLAADETSWMQEVAQILSDALPEYKFKGHKDVEKKQFCDNSKVTDCAGTSCWLYQSHVHADRLILMQILVQDVARALPYVRVQPMLTPLSCRPSKSWA